MSMITQAPFIVVAGIIGAGKTTLTQQLSDYLGYEPVYEPVEENPYLEDFYKDMAKYAFHMQMFLLTQRFRRHQECLWKGHGVVLDRSIYEDSIFARMHRDEGLLDNRDWETYISHFHVMQGFLRYPDVIVYLRCDPEVAMTRIQTRGRGAEEGMSLPYLQRLHEGYEEFVGEMNRYTVVCPFDWNEYQPVGAVTDAILAACDRGQKFLRSLRRI